MRESESSVIPLRDGLRYDREREGYGTERETLIPRSTRRAARGSTFRQFPAVRLA